MNSSESVECPLCMEPMDFDDVDFYPCPCRYQICRFCWFKIINEENGLCPACRKTYNSEHPAFYKPRTEEEIKNRIRHSKKVVPKKKPSNTDTKEYLAEYRVLQKNLIFVVGLPMRMADEIELLKGPDYFGRCGKVFKIVINQNQTFPGPQGSSCLSAYVTYYKPEEALRTLIDLKKLEIDGRAVKLSLGTTKYCSQFLKNRKCTKTDCMYLHEMGDPAASFTKEDMAGGRHTEYENQLIQEFIETQQQQQQQQKVSLTVGSGLTNKINSPITNSSKSVTGTPQSTSKPISAAAAVAAASSNNPSIIPIGTNPSDPATKLYSSSITSGSSAGDITSAKTGSNSPSDPTRSTVNNNSSLCSQSNTIDESNNSLSMHSQSVQMNFNYQTNNNGLSQHHFPGPPQPPSSLTRSNINFPPFPPNNNNQSSPTSDISSVNQDADIDFDPIKISRLGLAELIANENMQKYNMMRTNNGSGAGTNQSQNSGSGSSSQDYLSQSFSGMNLTSGNSNTNAIGISQSTNNNSGVSLSPPNATSGTSGTSATSPPPPPPGFELAALNTGVPPDDYMSFLPQQTTHHHMNPHNQTHNPHHHLPQQSHDFYAASRFAPPNNTNNNHTIDSSPNQHHQFRHHPAQHPFHHNPHLNFQNSYPNNASNQNDFSLDYNPTTQNTQSHYLNQLNQHHQQQQQSQQQSHNPYQTQPQQQGQHHNTQSNFLHQHHHQHHLSQPQILHSSVTPPTSVTNTNSVWKHSATTNPNSLIHNSSTQYCDQSPFYNTTDQIMPSHYSDMMRSSVYNRSHSMNESSGFLRNSEWNGYSHFSNNAFNTNNNPSCLLTTTPLPINNSTPTTIASSPIRTGSSLLSNNNNDSVSTTTTVGHLKHESSSLTSSIPVVPSTTTPNSVKTPQSHNNNLNCH